MSGVLARLTGRTVRSFKRRFYGTTFRCPVCHLELAHADLDANGLVVCPVCGVVMDVEVVYGHTVPVVNDVELFRPQPRSRIHPMATHLPIGLFPFAVLGAGLLFAVSAVNLVGTRLPACWLQLVGKMPVVADLTLVLLTASVGLSTLTFASGYWDWRHRYRGRPYRVISLKILFSAVFLSLGAAASVLHGLGLVFAAGTGLVSFASPAQVVLAVVYLGLLTANMAVIATLGHVGGLLVHGK